MAFRFQRRIRIAPGLRLNISKSGVGFSMGPRGATISVGKRGVFSNTGLPGTGLSYRQRLDSPAPRKSRKGSNGSTLPGPPASRALQFIEDGRLNVGITVHDSGEVEILYPDGTPLPSREAAVVRKHAGETLRSLVADECERLNQDLVDLARIHQHTPPPTDTPVFAPRSLGIPKPTRLPSLEPTFWQSFWPPARTRLQEENARRNQEYLEAFAEWETQRRRFDRQETLRNQIETSYVFHSVDAMAGVLSDHLGRIPWPKATEIAFDLGNNHRTIAIDIDLPTEDEIPTTQWSMPAKQLRVTAKKLSDTRRRELYMRYVHGVAFRVLGEVFARLPSVHCALVSGYTQAVDPSTGQDNDSYLYSVIARRSDWHKVEFSSLERIDPTAALANFTLRRSMTKTGMFKPIEPLTLQELEAACRKV